MMSTISPVFLPEPGLSTPVQAFETGFTSWDISQLFSDFDSSMNQIPGSDHDFVSPGSVSNAVPTENTDERRKKRKLSNRESAKRSREKKQKHLEEINIQLNQLKIENQELTNQLRYVLDQFQQTKTENDRLRLQHRILQEKLFNFRQILMFRHQMERISSCVTWPCNNSTVVTIPHDPTSFTKNHVLV